MPKKARLNGIKALRCYTVDEAAGVTGVSPHTIRRWARNGLPVLAATRPVLIRGDDLRSYIQAQRKNGKVKTGPCEFYCFRCRTARTAAGGFADCKINGNRVVLTALCSTCETVMHRPVSKGRILEIGQTLALTITGHETTL